MLQSIGAEKKYEVTHIYMFYFISLGKKSTTVKRKRKWVVGKKQFLHTHGEQNESREKRDESWCAAQIQPHQLLLGSLLNWQNARSDIIVPVTTFDT